MNPRRNQGHAQARLALLTVGLLFLTNVRLSATPDLRFDVVTFCCNCTSSSQMLCQNQFEHMNFPTLNGHYLAMGDDTHRFELLSNGNGLAIYFNTLNTGWTTNSGADTADAINQYSTNRFTSTGPRPDWVVLNELSAGTWPTDSSYRAWVRDVVHALHTTYGYSVILYSPFTNPGANAADWQAVAADAYIAIENYLSGQEVQNNGFSASWCQAQYQSSIASYNALGVPVSRLILGEHFGQTVTGTGYGRSGVSSNDWDTAIIARDVAIKNCAFAGSIGYSWGGDGLNVTSDEMAHYEDTYASNTLPVLTPVTAPFILLQPQPQVAPPGANVTFSVYLAGTAPATFQWRLNGTPLPGATSSTLLLTNIGAANAGYYTVAVTNAAGWLLSSNALLQVQIPSPIAFEPCADASAAGGTTYVVGANVIGQTNAQLFSWFQAGPASALTNQPTVRSGNLTIAGLAASAGNSIHFGGGGGMAARFQLVPSGTSLTTGTVYYSFPVMLTDLAGLSGSGVFWAGFNNSAGNQTTTPSVVATRVYTRAANGGYNFGLSKASSTSTDWQWDNTVHTANETVFLVGSYTFNTATTNDDVASLWINPDPTNFGAAYPPTPTLTTASGPDISAAAIRSFVLLNRDPTEPTGGVVDELRVGTFWASVTPPGAVSPLLRVTLNGTNLLLSWSTVSPGFALESTPVLSPAAWSPSPLAVFNSGTLYTATGAINGVAIFFRLHKP